MCDDIGHTSILLVGFTSIDPPYGIAAALPGKFAGVTELSNLNQLELTLLRKAYETVIG